MTNAEPTEDARLLNAFVDWMNNESEDMYTDQHNRDIFEAGWDAHKLETARLAAELAAAKADAEFAVLGTDEDGDQWITDQKYEDAESAQEYVDRFGGTVHRRSLGAWVALGGAPTKATK